MNLFCLLPFHVSLIDSKQSEQIMELFQKLNKKDNVTIIQVTHSEKMASYGDRIIYLKDGAVVEENPYLMQN